MTENPKEQASIDAAMQVLGITQAQYTAIIERWADIGMMDIPAPFIYGADDPHFRTWTTACLTDKRGVEELEKIVGPNVLPDFSMYTPSTPPLYRPDIPRVTIWEIMKNGAIKYWYFLTVRRAGIHGEIERYGIWCLLIFAILTLLAGIIL